jgi:hypothetical protein
MHIASIARRSNHVHADGHCLESEISGLLCGPSQYVLSYKWYNTLGLDASIALL